MYKLRFDIKKPIEINTGNSIPTIGNYKRYEDGIFGARLRIYVLQNMPFRKL